MFYNHASKSVRSLMEEAIVDVREEAPAAAVVAGVAGFDVVVALVDEDDGGTKTNHHCHAFEWLGSVNGCRRRSLPPAIDEDDGAP
ncbi:hypothetical protein ACLOJK_023212 [Asimina triloba]